MKVTRSGSSNALRAAIALVLASGGRLAPAAATESASSHGTLQEIVVTATKRAEDIEKVPLAVTALSTADLEKQGVVNITNLGAAVPGLEFGQSGGEVRLAMRGTRTNNVGPEAEQVVGIFQDGVYVPTTTQGLGAYVDVKRIEVLRGPQGTLYGRNTFGGAINVITNEPSFDRFSGNATALYGNYQRVMLQAIANLPISDSLAVRIAGMSDKHDGFIKNTYPGVPDLNSENLKFGRGSIRWKPTENFDATLRVNFDQNDSSGTAVWGYQQIGTFINGTYSPGNLWAAQYVTPATDPPSNHFDQGPWQVARNMASVDDSRSLDETLDVKWDVGPATLHYIGNNSDFRSLQTYDPDYSDGGSSVTAGFVGYDNNQHSMSHELQALSNGKDSLRWLLGLYYFKQSANWSYLERTNGVLSVPYWDNPGEFLSYSKGVFGQATYSLTKRLRVVAGLRYAEDQKVERDNLDFSTSPPTATPGPRGTWHKMLWKAGVEYDVAPTKMAYATVSTGYRPGGFNFVAAGVPLTYDSEVVTAYEVGLKSTFPDEALMLNLAAYYNRYRNMQAQQFVVIPGAIVSEYTTNGGAIDAKGLEAELNWTPGENWQVGWTLSLMDATFGKYSTGNIAGLGTLGGRQDPTNPNGNLSLQGWRPALSPPVKTSLQLSYDFNLPGGGQITPYVLTTFTSRYSASDYNIPGQYMHAYTLTTARLTWTDKSRKVSVDGYVQNLENVAVLNRVVVFNPIGGANLASEQANWGDPRTFGISLHVKF